MDAIEAIRLAYSGSHDWYRGTVSGVSPDAANRPPGGAAHPISYIAAHILHCEDVMINAVIQGSQSVWERDGWAQEFDIPIALDQEQSVAQSYRCDPAALGDYATSVWESTDDYLSRLKAEDLDGEVDLSAAGMGTMGLGAFLVTMLLGNNFAHTGEISALKGIMGSQGYPF